MASARPSRRKSQAAEKKLPSSAPTGRATQVLKKVWRPFPLFLAATAASLIVFWPEIVRHAPDLRTRLEYELPWPQVAVTSPGPWVPEELVDQVRQLSGLPDPLPMLEGHLAERVALAFSQHPWVAEVLSVKKTGPQRLRVDLRYREPALMVRTKRGVYPVDREGVLLPPSDFTIADAKRFPIVEGIRSLPEGPSGVAWGDAAVVGAARLAEVLTRQEDRTSPWEKLRLTSIILLDPPNRPVDVLEDVTLGLTTDTGSQIVWGRPPGADSLEPTVEQKLQRLEKYLPQPGDSQWPGAPVQLDVRQWDVVRESRLTPPPDRSVLR